MADTQERDPDVVSYTGFAGVRNDVDVERFEMTDLDLGENVDIDKTGQLSRRAGQTKLSAVATHSLWSDHNILGFCVQGTTLKRIALDNTLSTVLSGLTAGLPMSYVKVNDTVYFTNSRERGAYANDVVRTWGLEVPRLPAVSIGVGSLPAGSYQFVTTYVRSDGQESGAVTAGVVLVPANSSLQFTLQQPLGNDPTLLYQNLYVTAPNDDVLFSAASYSVATTAASYSSPLDRVYDLQSQFLSAPPAGQIVAYFAGRVYVAAGDVIYPSEPLAYELFDLRNYIPTDGRVTMIAPYENKESLDQPGQSSGLFIGTDRSCGVLVGTSPENFRYVPKIGYGAIEGALDYVEGTVFEDGRYGVNGIPMWLTTQGICAGMPDMEIRNLTRARYTFTAAGRGAAIWQSNPNRFIAVSNF
jgi:hypothetical protein